MYTAYYYDNARDQFPGDANELSINGTFVSHITCVRTADNIADLSPKTETEEIILIVPSDTKILIDNYNPCPEERY